MTEQTVVCFSVCSLVSVVSWRHSDIKETYCFLCHYQIDGVTNLGTTVGHYTNNSYMCTLERLICMSSPLHRHTLKQTTLQNFNNRACMCVAARPWPVICLWLALTHAWGSPTVGVPTGALSAGVASPLRTPSPEPIGRPSALVHINQHNPMSQNI